MLFPSTPPGCTGKRRDLPACRSGQRQRPHPGFVQYASDVSYPSSHHTRHRFAVAHVCAAVGWPLLPSWVYARYTNLQFIFEEFVNIHILELFPFRPATAALPLALGNNTSCFFIVHKLAAFTARLVIVIIVTIIARRTRDDNH